MPDLTKLPVPEYAANQPYHWEYDNLPLKVLAERDLIISNAVDNQTQILNDAAGTQGNIANRLLQSIDEDGNIKSSAINESLHSISAHEDGQKSVSSTELDYYINTLGYAELVNPVGFVRMLEAEREKLSLIAEEATSLKLEFCGDSACTASNITLFENEKVQFQPSEYITWEFTSPNVIKPILNMSVEFAHRHYYDIEPITENYINYDVNSINSSFVEGSLRVYINGARLSEEYEVFYPLNPSDASWATNNNIIKGGYNKFTSDHVNGTFSLANAITENDIIRIDFDVYVI